MKYDPSNIPFPEIWLDIAKADAAQHIVEGYASSERLDNQGEIVDSKAIKAALPGFMEWANVREMHANKAVGTVLKAEVIDGDVEVNGKILKNPLHIIVKVVDKDTWEKVVTGVLRGFSIGGRALKAVMEKLGDTGKKIRRIVELALLEISLVDRPANPDAMITVWKGIGLQPRGGTEDMKKVMMSFGGKDYSVDLSNPAGIDVANAFAALDPDGNSVVVVLADGLGAITGIHAEVIQDTGDADAAKQPEAETETGEMMLAAGARRGRRKKVPAAAVEWDSAVPEKEVIGKAAFNAGKHEKAVSDVVASLQELRNECEALRMDDCAQMYTQAIQLTNQACDQATQPEEEEPTEEEVSETPEEEGAEGEIPEGEEMPEEGVMDEGAADDGTGVTQVAQVKWKKAGRTFSGKNTSGMHTVIRNLAQLLADSGDPIAAKIIKAYGKIDEPEATEKSKGIKAEDIAKAVSGAIGDQFSDLAQIVRNMEERIEHVERIPLPGGPRLKTGPIPVRKSVAPNRAGPIGMDVNALRQAALTEPNLALRKQYQDMLDRAERGV